MSAEAYKSKRRVSGPNGNGPTLDMLPPPDTTRWVVRRKAEVVAAVTSRLLGVEEACARYGLSLEEFLSWQRMMDSHGRRGLRTTRLQAYRRNERAP